METNNLETNNTNSIQETKPGRNYLIPLSILLSASILGGAWIYTAGLKELQRPPLAQLSSATKDSAGSCDITGAGGGSSSSSETALPAIWGNLGKQMIDAGVIDANQFEQVYASRGGLDAEAKKLLYDTSNTPLVMNEQNAGFLLNLFWALGLGNKNEILEKGPMSDPEYGGAGNFASTGGWTIAKGDVMDHYSRHPFIILTPEQQQLVERVSKNIYRPCCGNSTYFPDCNHGMAMLGLLELMASQGASEKQMYQAALKVNSYWFPDTYAGIAEYLRSNGLTMEKMDPEEILGVNYSSSAGWRQIQSKIQPTSGKNQGGGCGV